jgi:SAM-dependent methyltransferase
MENNQIIECLLCGGPTELRHSEYPGYQEPQTFKIYYCPSCNSAFSLPRIETEELYENIYKKGEIVPGYDRYWEYAKAVKKITNPLKYLAGTEATYWGVSEALSFFVRDKKSSKILEIGSGLGYLTYSLIKSGYDVVGLDISQTAVKQAIENFGNHYICANILEYARKNLEAFDIVILTEVIEHIDEPINFLESVYKILKPAGKVIITTPNKSFYPIDIIWATELPPIHCWWFSEESIKYISKRLNMTFSFINFYDYYKNKKLAIDIKILQNNNLPKPTFNKNGELLLEVIRTNRSLFSYIRLKLSRIPYLKNLYWKLQKTLNEDKIICKEKGLILCTILEKL